MCSPRWNLVGIQTNNTSEGGTTTDLSAVCCRPMRAGRARPGRYEIRPEVPPRRLEDAEAHQPCVLVYFAVDPSQPRIAPSFLRVFGCFSKLCPLIWIL